MKIEISLGKENGENDNHDMDKPMKKSPFQKKVAKMLAAAAGRPKPNMLDEHMAAKFEEKNSMDED